MRARLCGKMHASAPVLAGPGAGAAGRGCHPDRPSSQGWAREGARSGRCGEAGGRCQHRPRMGSRHLLLEEQEGGHEGHPERPFWESESWQV